MERGWIPEFIDLGALPTMSGEFNYVTNSAGVGMCLDPEHFNVECLMSKEYNLGNIRNQMRLYDTRMTNDDWGMLEEFGFVTIKGLPRLYREALDLDQEIRNTRNIRIGHMVSCCPPVIRNGRDIMIGSHMPLDPDNLFIKDKESRREWWEETVKIIPEIVRAMKDQGCYDFVLEPKVGDQTGELYIDSMVKTVNNFVSLTSEA